MEAQITKMIWTALTSGNEVLFIEDYQVVADGVRLMVNYIMHHVQQEFFISHLSLYQEYFNALAAGDETAIYQVAKEIRELTQQPIFE